MDEPCTCHGRHAHAASNVIDVSRVTDHVYVDVTRKRYRKATDKQLRA